MNALRDETQARRSARLGLILGAVAVVCFFGYILLMWLSRR